MICGSRFTTPPPAATSWAAPITNAPTGVSNGLFSVTLNLGAGVFAGPARWLEIGARTNGSAASYATLSSAPGVDGLAVCNFCGYCLHRGPGSVVTSLNGLKDNVTLAAGSNVTINSQRQYADDRLRRSRRQRHLVGP